MSNTTGGFIKKKQDLLTIHVHMSPFLFFFYFLRVAHLFSFLCLCVSNVAYVSGLSIIDGAIGFLWHLFVLKINLTDNN